ncbi:hypothetical protein AKJ08_0473 [Vulgatibacter incomptus]|uniref:Uncharacterized protein n=1 Tax=Vulgatibacter incomptus TaxID=1391653 RepID=A0A0K1P9I2_9BACT|nr:hypothetical protein AKJ08_0473 [Vulgatibacter incomptus]
MTLRVDDRFGSEGVGESVEVNTRPDMSPDRVGLGDRLLVILAADREPQAPWALMRVDDAGVVHFVGERAEISVERAASIALSPDCIDQATTEVPVKECRDMIAVTTCSSGGGGAPAILTVGAVVALFASLRSRRRVNE